MCDSAAHLASHKCGDPFTPSVWGLRHSKSADDFFMGWWVAVAARDRGGVSSVGQDIVHSRVEVAPEPIVGPYRADQFCECGGFEVVIVKREPGEDFNGSNILYAEREFLRYQTPVFGPIGRIAGFAGTAPVHSGHEESALLQHPTEPSIAACRPSIAMGGTAPHHAPGRIIASSAPRTPARTSFATQQSGPVLGGRNLAPQGDRRQSCAA